MNGARVDLDERRPLRSFALRVCVVAALGLPKGYVFHRTKIASMAISIPQTKCEGTRWSE